MTSRAKTFLGGVVMIGMLISAFLWASSANTQTTTPAPPRFIPLGVDNPGGSTPGTHAWFIDAEKKMVVLCGAPAGANPTCKPIAMP